MLTEIHSYGLIECNLSLTYPTQFGPKTWYMVLRLKQKRICNLLYFYLLQMYKRFSSNATKEGSKNHEKITFGLPQEKKHVLHCKSL